LPVLRRLRALWGDPDHRRDALFLLALCLAEALLFWRTSPSFFDGDAFFYFAHPVRGVGAAIRALTSVDTARQYRPLGSLLFSFLFEPLFGFHYRLYAATAVLTHMVNTVLAFLILDRLLADRLAVRSATVFWGLNPVAIYVTHSFSFFADFSYAFFYLVAILAFLRYTRTEKTGPFVLAGVAFLLALMSKELAVTLPAMLILITVAFLREDGGRPVPERAAQRLVWTLFLMLATFLGFYALLKGGRFYDSAPQLNYFPRFTPAVLFGKVDYFLSALYLPLAEKMPSDETRMWSHRLVYASAPAVFLFMVFALWPPVSLARRVRGGLLWALLGATPIVFLTPSEFTHNLYLPALGLALAFGLFWSHLTAFVRDSRWLRPFNLHLYGLGVALLSLYVNQRVFEEGNWRPHWEIVAKTWLEETRRVVPDLRPPRKLYVLRSGESDEWSLYSGELLRTFYREPALQVLFADQGAPLPLEEARRGEVSVLIMLDGHVHDVTTNQVKEAETEGALSLVRELEHARVSLVSDRPADQPFETPTGQPAFVGGVLAGEDYRTALITLGGTRVRYPVQVGGAGRLTFGINKRFQLGDGVVARIFFEGPSGRQILYERRLNPRDVPADRRWFEGTVDLGRFQGQTGTIELECTAGPIGDDTADWLAWSGLFVEGARLL
jgi:hypothetical protein